jgi:hypothetical protein
LRLLRPERIGIELTEGFMMEPEASISALALHTRRDILFSSAQEVARGDCRLTGKKKAIRKIRMALNQIEVESNWR